MPGLLSNVMAWLDPAIESFDASVARLVLDGRVKPCHDNGVCS
jgi:hypothetical protein